MNAIRSLLLLAASSAVLAACATAGTPSPEAQTQAAAAQAEKAASDVDAAAADAAAARSPPIRSTTSSYGLVLAGRAAMNDGLSDRAFAYYDRIEGLKDDPFLRARAFKAALLSGDISRAATLAPDEPGDDAAAYRLGRLTRLVDALATGRAKEARDLVANDGVGFPHASAAELLKPWVAAMNNDVPGSLVRPEVKGDRLVTVFGQMGQTLLYERAGRFDDAESNYKALSALGGAGGLFVLDYGGFLERRGRRADAIVVYDAALAEIPGDGEVIAARARAVAKKPAPQMLSLRQGAAKVLTAPAAGKIADRDPGLALAYMRMVLRLDPQRNDALLLVGDILQASGDASGARAAYARIPVGSSQYVSARGKLAWTYQNGGDKPAALKLAAETAKAHPESQEAQVTLIDLLRSNERYAEAVSIADGLVAKAGAAPDWRLLYLRGAALEQAGRWPEAERDLQMALAQNPNEPQLLNFLGYSWIDRGENLPRALDMVRRAAAANPRSGAILDSLGWAYYRTGDYKQAVETLERAVELEPGDPDVNNHLGDAYWRVGRRDEARFQWRRVLTLEPDERIRTDAETKLKSGLETGPSTIAAAGTP